MSFAVVNLGCRVNRAESDSIVQKMLLNDEIASPETADTVFVNTCTVTGVAEKKTRKTVRHILENNKNATVIVTGCATEINPSFFESLSDRVKVVPKFELLFNSSSDFLADAQNISRVNIKIQDGCNNACTFCIVHVARGKSVSVSQNEVIKSCVALDEAGVKEIVLTGINLGNYSDPTLAELLKVLLLKTHGCRYRISSIEPPEVTQELLEVIKDSDWRVCHHFHLPLQSGSDEILKKMDRHYSSGDFIDLINNTKLLFDDFSFTTDVIVGFPGETEKDFQDTIDVVKQVSFSKVHVFPYSKRVGTPAAEMVNQIPEDVKCERAKKLRELASVLRRQEFIKRVGKKEFAVTESNNCATTDSYFTIKSDAFRSSGELLNVELKEEMFFG